MIRLSATTSLPWFLPLFLSLAVPASAGSRRACEGHSSRRGRDGRRADCRRDCAAVATSDDAGPGRGCGAGHRPADNLVVEGVPAIPKALAEKLQRYTEFRAASF